MVDKYKIDPKRVEGIFERVSLLVHGIYTVIATTTMDYSNEQVIKIVNDELMNAGNRNNNNSEKKRAVSVW